MMGGMTVHTYAYHTCQMSVVMHTVTLLVLNDTCSTYIYGTLYSCTVQRRVLPRF